MANEICCGYPRMHLYLSIYTWGMFRLKYQWTACCTEGQMRLGYSQESIAYILENEQGFLKNYLGWICEWILFMRGWESWPYEPLRSFPLLLPE